MTKSMEQRKRIFLLMGKCLDKNDATRVNIRTSCLNAELPLVIPRHYEAGTSEPTGKKRGVASWV